jgi:histone-lysine N-methyltransferase SETD1
VEFPISKKRELDLQVEPDRKRQKVTGEELLVPSDELRPLEISDVCNIDGIAIADTATKAPIPPRRKKRAIAKQKKSKKQIFQEREALKIQ